MDGAYVNLHCSIQRPFVKHLLPIKYSLLKSYISGKEVAHVQKTHSENREDGDINFIG